MEEFFKKILKFPNAMVLLGRLGLGVEDFDFTALKSGAKKLSKTDFVQDLLIDSFHFSLDNELKYLN